MSEEHSGTSGTHEKRSRLGRWWLVAGVAVGIVLLLMLFMPLYSPLFGGYLANSLEEATGRKVKLQSFSCSLLTSRLAIEGLSIKEADETTDFLTVGKMEVDFSLWPLLKNRIRVPDAQMQDARIRIEIEEDGTTNYGPLLRRLSGEEPTAPPGDLPDVKGRFALRNVAVDFADHRSGLRSKLVDGNARCVVDGLENITYASRCREIELTRPVKAGPRGGFGYELDGKLSVRMENDSPIVDSSGTFSAVRISLEGLPGEPLHDRSAQFTHDLTFKPGMGEIRIRQLDLHSDYLRVTASDSRITGYGTGRGIEEEQKRPGPGAAISETLSAISWNGGLVATADPRSIGTDFGPLIAQLGGGLFRADIAGHPLMLVPPGVYGGGDLMLQLNELKIAASGSGRRKTLRGELGASAFVGPVQVPIRLLWESVMEPEPGAGITWEARLTEGPLRGLRLKGRMEPPAADLLPAVSANVVLPTIELSPELVDLAPVRLPDWMEDVDLSGAITGGGAMDLDGTGDLSFSGRMDTFGVNVTSGSLPIFLRGFSASLYADNKRIQCRSFVGRAWDGFATGSAVLRLGKGSEPALFDCRLTLGGASLEQMTRTDGQAEGEGKYKGRVDFTVDASGDPRDLRSVTGRGRLDIIEGRIARLPMLAGLLNVLKLGMPSRGVFDQGEVEFRIADGKVQIRKLLLSSETLDITGKGNVSLEGDAKLVMAVSTSARDSGGIPLLSQAVGAVVRGIQRTVLPPVLVHGKIWEPDYRVLALEPVKKPLRSLTGLIPLLPSPDEVEEE